MKFYFLLQAKRVYRHIDEFGIIPLIGFAVIIAVFIACSNALFDNLANAAYYYIFLGVGLSLKLSSSKHTRFLKKCFPSKTFQKVRILENMLFVLPFSIFLCYKHLFIEACSLLSIALATSFFNKLEIKSFVILTPFGKKPFEFTIGFRNSFWLLLLAYGLTYIAIHVENYNLGVFSLIVVFLTCMSYYMKPEPLYYVWVHAETPREFLHTKIKTAIIYSSYIVLPVIVALSVAFPIDMLQITLLFTCIGYSFITLTILGKYHNYPTNIPLFQTLAMLVSLLFPPLLLIIIPIFYRKSIKNLNAILTC